MFILTLISDLFDGSLVIGLITGLWDLAFSLARVALIDSYSRWTFGLYNLSVGFQLLPVLIGIFCGI